MIPFVRQILRNNRGAVTIEYALILLLVSITIIGALSSIGIDINYNLRCTARTISAELSGGKCGPERGPTITSRPALLQQSRNTFQKRSETQLKLEEDLQ